MRIERADKRYQPLHLLRLVIEPAVYLRVADKPPVAQRLQRARAYSQLPADLLARDEGSVVDIDQESKCFIV